MDYRISTSNVYYTPFDAFRQEFAGKLHRSMNSEPKTIKNPSPPTCQDVFFIEKDKGKNDD